jgi:hypothetical protein
VLLAARAPDSSVGPRRFVRRRLPSANTGTKITATKTTHHRITSAMGDDRPSALDAAALSPSAFTKLLAPCSALPDLTFFKYFAIALFGEVPDPLVPLFPLVGAERPLEVVRVPAPGPLPPGPDPGVVDPGVVLPPGVVVPGVVEPV